MTGEVEEDNLFFACLDALLCLANGSCNGMARFRSRDDAFCLGKQATGFEGFQLVDVHRFHQSVLQELRNDDTGTVEAQTSGMDIGRSKLVSQGVHREQRSVTGFVGKVIMEFTTGELRARSRFGCDEACLAAFLDGVAHEREADTTEVGTATEATDNDVRIFASHLHLLFGFEADNRLVKGNVAQYRAEGIFTVRCGTGQFDSFRNGCTERTLMIRSLGQDVLTSTGGHGR